MNERNERKRAALTEILRMAKKNQIYLDDLKGLLPSHAGARDTGLESKRDTRRSVNFTQLFYYLGALFLFSGILSYFLVYLCLNRISLLQIVSTLMGSGGLAFLMAGLSLKKLAAHQSVWGEKKLVYFLLFIAVLCQSSGLVLAFDPLSAILKEEIIGALVYLALAMSVGLALISIRREPLYSLGLGYLLLFWFFVFQGLGISEELSYLVLGGCLCALAYYCKPIAEKFFLTLWYFLGSSMMLCGIFNLVLDRPLEILFPCLSVGFAYLGVRLQQKALFFSGTLGTLLYINVLLYRYLAKSLNIPLLTILLGFVCILVGRWLARIYRKQFV